MNLHASAKPIAGHEDRYYVTDDGRVWSNRAGRYLRNHEDGSGYQFVALYSADGKKTQPKVHVLVAKAFILNANNLPVVNHRDGIKSNNYASNLEWMTQAQNIRHSFDIGLSNQKGSQNAFAKLNEAAVVEIREMAATGILQKNIAETFAVSRATVCGIVKRKTWAHVQEKTHG